MRPKANKVAGVVQKGLPGKKHKGLRRFSCRWGKRARKRTELLQGHPRDVGVLGEGD